MQNSLRGKVQFEDVEMYSIIKLMSILSNVDALRHNNYIAVEY